MSQLPQNMMILDRMNELGSTDPLFSFALDELLCRRAGHGGPAVCHIWRHPQAFVLGSQDLRLPNAREAMEWLESNGWPVAVRNSGGAAVPLDGGVVNLSLIFPNSVEGHSGYQFDFEAMFKLIREALSSTGRVVEKGLVEGAYCPGDYDLGIDGRKFCGIAQRRQVNATIIQAFVVAEGSGSSRAEFVRAFYDIASGGDDSLGHPIVEGQSTASLEELAGLGPMGAFSFAGAVKNVLAGAGIAASYDVSSLPNQIEIEEKIASIRARYAQVERS
ncbi:lipoate--protein ligase family protein [Paenibacillus soyae]|uniref:Lipoate--protein ligase family protein n=1 Tax=Paenibacillus soyae TaxID=2969249 RepID=A0A9X2MSK4_9BACL|nr:lipoate--protein ligase family protein [Paenibacillus soyae]MCR2805454.1 lipoate--protein ligase family protein [Paenibacillus soyae]